MRIALACFALMLSACDVALAQICRPVSERTGELGCWITANAALGQLRQRPIFWHLDTFPTLVGSRNFSCSKGRGAPDA